jgi:hypothetical protein
VLDLLLEAPLIIRKSDQVSRIDKERRVPFLVELLQDCITLDDKIQDLLLEFELSAGGLLYWAVPSKLAVVTEVLDAPVDSDELSSLSYEFPTVQTGTTMMLCWAGLTILWSGVCHIYESISHLTTLSPTVDGKLEGQFNTDGYSQTFQIPLSTRFTGFPTLARNVCQSVEFCLRDEMSAPTMIAPLAMVVDGLSSWPGFDKEVAWARSQLLDIQNRGMNIVKYLPRA